MEVLRFQWAASISLHPASPQHFTSHAIAAIFCQRGTVTVDLPVLQFAHKQDYMHISQANQYKHVRFV